MTGLARVISLVWEEKKVVNDLRFSSIILLFNEEDKGFGRNNPPMGYLKLETREGKGSLSALVQNLKDSDEYTVCKLYFIKYREGEVAYACMGTIPLKNGRGGITRKFDAINVENTNLRIDEYNAAAIVLEREIGGRIDVKCPLAVYKAKDEKTRWDHVFGKFAAKVKMRSREERGITGYKEESREIENIPGGNNRTSTMDELHVRDKASPGDGVHENVAVQEAYDDKLKMMTGSSGEAKEYGLQERGMGEHEVQGHGAWAHVTEEHEVQESGLKENDMKEQGMQEYGVQEHDMKEHDAQEHCMQEGDMQRCGMQGHDMLGHEKQEKDMQEYDAQAHEMQEDEMKQGDQAQTGYNNYDDIYSKYTGTLESKYSFVENMKRAHPGVNCQRCTSKIPDIELLSNCLDKAFKRCDPFNTKRQDYKWWKVTNPVHLSNILYYCNIHVPKIFSPPVIMAYYKYRYLITGIYTSRKRNKVYIVHGIPGTYNVDESPLGDLCRWVQTEGNTPRYGSFGYWVVYVDPFTGEFLRLNR